MRCSVGDYIAIWNSAGCISIEDLGFLVSDLAF